MLRAFAALLTTLPLIMTPAMVAQGMSSPDGAGLSGALFAIAVALVLTLLVKRMTARWMQTLTTLVGDYRLRRALRDYSEFLVSDFIVPGAYGGLSRIDHALLTPAGVLCIRAVHRHGKVYGSDGAAQWCHVAGGRRRRFLNPLIQNEGRARALASALAPSPVRNLVVFTASPRFASTMPENVITLSELTRWLEKFTFAADAIDDLDESWRRLASAAVTDAESRKDFEAQIGFC